MKISLFIKNTVIVVFTGLILRMVGMFFKVWLAEKIGSEGLGLYQLIFSVYTLAATFATAGISTAVPRLVSEEEQNGLSAVKKVMSRAVWLTLSAALLSTTIIYFGAEPIAIYLLKDTRAVMSLKILSFSLPFMGLSSLSRGYFLARRKQIQPSAVQMVEQAVRIAVTITAVGLTIEKGLAYTSAAVLLGDVVAETASFFLNWILYIIDRKNLPKEGQTPKKTVRRILHIAMPITGSSYISSALHTAESLLVPIKLSVFHGSKERALELFGAIKGMALPTIFFPAAFLSSMSTMLIPEVSSAKALGDFRKVRQTISQSVGTTLVLSCFIAIGFMLNADDISMIIYNDTDVGGIIKTLSPIIPFMYLESVTAGLLKGLDCQLDMLYYNTFDSILRITAVLTVLPFFGIKGYLGIMIVSNIFTCSLSAVCLFRSAQIKPDMVNWLLVPIGVSLLGGVLGKMVANPIENSLLHLILSLGIQGSVCFVYWILTCKHKKNVIN